jgi:hypothetical protein
MNTLTAPRTRRQADPEEVRRRHMTESQRLEETIEELFRQQDKLPSGIKKGDVEHMTKFQQIELLERIIQQSLSIGKTPLERTTILVVVQEVNKEDFRTADDPK